RGLGAFEDTAGIDTELAKRIHDVGSITHQPANFDKVARRIDRREPVERRQLDHLDTSRFAINSSPKKLTPVRFPPGRARLATTPSPTGSWAAIKAIGIVVVAALAAGAAVVALAAITVTCRRTSSAANSGSRSFWSSAKR